MEQLATGSTLRMEQLATESTLRMEHNDAESILRKQIEAEKIQRQLQRQLEITNAEYKQLLDLITHGEYELEYKLFRATLARHYNPPAGAEHKERAAQPL